MLDVIISIIVAIISIFISVSTIRYPLLKKEKHPKVFLPQNIKHYLFAFGMIASIAIVMVSSLLLYEHSWIECSKRVILISFLWAISLFDFRKHIIPNKILLILLAIRVVIVVFQFIFISNIKTELLDCFIAGLGIIIILCVMRFVVKEGIGFGDVKLFGVIGLFLGIEGILTVVFLSFVASFLISIFMLVTKRKNKKDYLAFAPSILIGTIVSFVLFGA